MVTRRQLLAAGGAGSAALLLTPGRAMAAGPAGRLDPHDIPKYVSRLAIPREMPRLRGHHRSDLDEYVIGVRQMHQQVLPDRMPATRVWCYGSPDDLSTYTWPARTIEARVDRPVRVTWVNELVDRHGRFRPHLFPVDPTLHWANPPGGRDGRDRHTDFTSTPKRYNGPVPMVTHLHGSRSHEDSDGYPEAWYLPVARDVPARYATVGSYYHEFRRKHRERCGSNWSPGAATFQYENEQRAGALWYHDHTLGMTRVNVYAGALGFYFIRGGRSDLPDGVLPGPTPGPGCGPVSGCHEIPMVIQDRSFNADGSLFYPGERPPIGGYRGPYIPDSDVPPMWAPGYFADTMVVNGRTWPVHRVEPRRYRLRLLNGCNSRHLILKITADPTARPGRAALPIWQIGYDAGFLPEPVRSERMGLANGERADVIIDFTGLKEGTELYLINEGPDGPYAGGEPGREFPPADPRTTGQVMKFVVGRLSCTDRTVAPEQLSMPSVYELGPATVTRRLLLNMTNSTKHGAGPVAHMLGTVAADGRPTPRSWHDPVAETPALGATEVWEFSNYTREAHPIHLHQVQVQVLGRGHDGRRPPELSESAYKDVVTTLPGETTRIKAHFTRPGRFVWHCHILEHEDNEMMLPYIVGGGR